MQRKKHINNFIACKPEFSKAAHDLFEKYNKVNFMNLVCGKINLKICIHHFHKKDE